MAKIKFDGRFRGKDYTHHAYPGAWVYGKLYVEKYHYIVDDTGCAFIVPYESVGRWTGYVDLKGNEIYQEDFIEYGGKNKKIYRVDCGDFVKRVGKDFSTRIVKFYNGDFRRWQDRVICHIIGNAYDNPELLEAIQNESIKIQRKGQSGQLALW